VCDGKKLSRGDKVTTLLKKGWNSLVFRSDHSQWLWAFQLELRGVNGDALKDVRVSLAEPSAAASSAPAPAPTK
jgi:hypothetical protein